MQRLTDCVFFALDKPGTRVNGVIKKDGRFQGVVFDGEEEFYIDRAEKFLTDSAVNSDQPLTDLVVGCDPSSYVLASCV